MEMDGRPGVIEGLEIKRKLAEIFSLFQQIIPGSIVRQRRRFVLKMDDQDGVLNVENWSAGIKSFAILRRLLENGTLHEKGVLILDEPEIHLHPEWQLRFSWMLSNYMRASMESEKKHITIFLRMMEGKSCSVMFLMRLIKSMRRCQIPCRHWKIFAQNSA